MPFLLKRPGMMVTLRIPLRSCQGRASIAPERPLRALLLQVFYSIRSERMLMGQMEYNLLFRWFVGLNMDDQVWDASTFSQNRKRLLRSEVAQGFSIRCGGRRSRRGRCRMSTSAWTWR